MSLDGNRQAILLLCAHFSRPQRGDPTPLTPTEYGKLSSWLRDKGLEPDDLLSRLASVREASADLGGKITVDRIRYLLGRGMAMGIALEKWNSAGIWVVTRADSEYPERLRKRLGRDAPAVLFGVGNRRLLNAGGLAMVGSRDVDPTDQSYARQIAECASNAGMNIVSGAARGVDETAMLAALEIQGTALGILANGLMPAALSGKWRPHLKSNELCLASPYYPEAGFNVGNAMGRNKYIYCLSDYGLVVRSDKEKGGTWAGATEALKKKLAPVFVKSDSEATGNAALIECGALALNPPADENLTAAWLTRALSGGGTAEAESTPGPRDRVEEQVLTPPVPERSSDGEDLEDALPTPPATAPSQQTTLFFDYFVLQLTQLLISAHEITLKELKERHPDLSQKQLTDWLNRAVDEGQLERPGKAHRYTLKSAAEVQRDLFGANKN